MYKFPPKRQLLAATISSALGLMGALLPPPAHAQAPKQQVEQLFSIELPAQALSSSLTMLSTQTGVQIYTSSELVVGRNAPAVSGRMSAREALNRLLAGSNLVARTNAAGNVTIQSDPAGHRERTLPEVKVQASTFDESAWGPVEGYSAKRSATGTKTDTPIIETPQSISVVTADYAEAIGATNLKEALSYTPGINIAPYGSDSRYDWVYLRGFDGYSSIHLDGLPLRNIASLSVWRTENYNLERFEVLRGPSSVLYGQNSPGGLINAVSKRPTNRPLRELQLQLGEDSRKQIAGDFSGPVDEEGKLLYRLTALVKDGELPAEGMDDDRYFIAPSLTWRPSEDTSLTILSQFMSDRAGVYTSIAPYQGTLLGNPNGKVSSSDFLSEPDFNQFDQDQWMLGYVLEHRVRDNWTLRQNARYSHMKLDYWQASTMGDYNNGYAPFIVVNGDSSDPANYRLRYLAVNGTKSKATSFVIDNQAEGKLKFGPTEHTLLIGLDHQRTRFDESAYFGISDATIDVFNPSYGAELAIPAPYSDARIRLRQTGLYLQDQIKFDERWVVTLGGRYDWARIETDDHLSGSESHQNDEKFTGRAGLVYLAPNGLAPYVSYAESFVPTVTINPETGKPFDPETGRQYEIGLRYQPPGRNEMYSLAAFDLRRRNYITEDVLFVPRQRGEITVRGMEIEAYLQPLERMNLTLSYTFTPKADITKSADATEVGKQANPVSRHQASVWADYSFPGGFKAGLGVRYVGPNDGYDSAAPKRVPGYTLFDAMIGYDFKQWSLALNARNLTDKTYYSQCGYGMCYFGDERRIVATATYRW